MVRRKSFTCAVCDTRLRHNGCGYTVVPECVTTGIMHFCSPEHLVEHFKKKIKSK